MPHSSRFHRRQPLPVRSVSQPGRGAVSPSYCQIWQRQPVRVVGRPIRAEVEFSHSEENIDHVWLTIEVPKAGDVLLAVNTSSIFNRRAGFDPRVRMGISRSPCHRLPPLGVFPSRLLNYEVIESNANVFYETLERPALEALLLEKANRATLIQAWGMAFCNQYLGVHQIHSRRASCAIPLDLQGQDGGLRFYFREEERAELVLLKFCGQ